MLSPKLMKEFFTGTRPLILTLVFMALCFSTSEGIYLLPFPETDRDSIRHVALEIPGSYDPSVPGRLAGWERTPDRKESRDRAPQPAALTTWNGGAPISPLFICTAERRSVRNALPHKTLLSDRAPPFS